VVTDVSTDSDGLSVKSTDVEGDSANLIYNQNFRNVRETVSKWRGDLNTRLYGGRNGLRVWDA